MRAALRRALAKAPTDRFQTVRDFFAAFSGAAPLGGPTMMTPAAPVRGKTEVGAPLDIAAAFGAPAAVAPVTAQGYTPVGGNVAFPTPAGIPQPEPLDASANAGSGRGKLLAAAGVIAAASAVAIAFALKGPGSQPVVFDNASASGPAPATSLSAGSAAAEASSVSDTPAGEVPPLKAAGAHASTMHDPAHPNSSASPAASSANQHAGPEKSPFGAEPLPYGSEKSPFGSPGPAGNPARAQGSPQAAPAAPGQYDGPECARARMLRGIGRRHEAQQWALTCLAKGGNPD